MPIADDNEIESNLDLIIIQKYLERKPIAYNEADINNKEIANVIIKGGIIYNQERSNYIEKQLILEINNNINECVKILKSINFSNFLIKLSNVF